MFKVSQSGYICPYIFLTSLNVNLVEINLIKHIRNQLACFKYLMLIVYKLD